MYGTKVPGSIISLLPPNSAKRNLSATKAQERVAVPANAVPRFGAPPHLVSDRFWSNLKQFLTDRPVKVVEGPGAPFTRNAFVSGVGENLTKFLSARPVRTAPLNT